MPHTLTLTLGQRLGTVRLPQDDTVCRGNLHGIIIMMIRNGDLRIVAGREDQLGTSIVKVL
jgi:hypothetical protein